CWTFAPGPTSISYCTNTVSCRAACTSGRGSTFAANTLQGPHQVAPSSRISERPLLRDKAIASSSGGGPSVAQTGAATVASKRHNAALGLFDVYMAPVCRWRARVGSNDGMPVAYGWRMTNRTMTETLLAN